MPAGAKRAQRPLKVFLVEDSPFVRERLASEFAHTSDAQFVGSAESETDAVEQLRNLDCDAVVLDINLARGSGFGVLKSIRAHRERRPCVIVFTNYAYDYYRELTIAMGADYFLDKATEFNRLLEIIHALPVADGGVPN